MQILIISLVWLVGFILSFLMQRTEIAAEKQPYTTGDRLLITVLSLLSFAWVLAILITAWIKSVSGTGYWNEPVKKEKDIIVVAEKPVEKKGYSRHAQSTDN